MGINKVILVGNLGKDPELRMTNSQMQVATFSIATSEKRKEAGNWVDKVEWHNVVTFGSTAENCAKFLKKGRQVYIEGRIQSRKWQDKEGKDRYTTEIIANTVQFLGGGGGKESGRLNNAVEVESNSAGNELLNSLPSADDIATTATASFEDDDIPF